MKIKHNLFIMFLLMAAIHGYSEVSSTLKQDPTIMQKPALAAQEISTDEKEKNNQSTEPASGPVASTVKTTTIGGIEFVYIPAGTYKMGSAKANGWSDETPLHEVEIRSFWMSTYEITQKQFEEIMKKNPSLFQDENRPVNQVSWNDAVEFCEKFSTQNGVKVRLPYEAEWEYACRAGTSTKYYWGNEMNGDYCWYIDNSNSTPHHVGQKKPNAWGLYDMCGNVWEWCIDWYNETYYAISKGKNPTGPETGAGRVLRGGAFHSKGTVTKSATRHMYHPIIKYSAYGFRVVMLDTVP